jgi:hypothetical protein
MGTDMQVSARSHVVYVRIEPTCDPIVQRYAPKPNQWCDLAFYRDATATQFYARRCSCLRWRLRARPSRVMLNCFNWSVRWLPSVAAEVRDGDE